MAFKARPKEDTDSGGVALAEHPATPPKAIGTPLTVADIQERVAEAKTRVAAAPPSAIRAGDWGAVIAKLNDLEKLKARVKALEQKPADAVSTIPLEQTK